MTAFLSNGTFLLHRTTYCTINPLHDTFLSKKDKYIKHTIAAFEYS